MYLEWILGTASLSVLAEAKQIISRAAHWLLKPSCMCLLDAFTFLQMQRNGILSFLSLPMLLPSALNEGRKQKKYWCKVIEEISILKNNFASHCCFLLSRRRFLYSFLAQSEKVKPLCAAYTWRANLGHCSDSLWILPKDSHWSCIYWHQSCFSPLVLRCYSLACPDVTVGQ